MENRWSRIHSVAEPRLTVLPYQLGLAPTRNKKNTLRCLGVQWKRSYSQGCQARKLASKPQIRLPKAIFFRCSLDEEEAEDEGDGLDMDWDEFTDYINTHLIGEFDGIIVDGDGRFERYDDRYEDLEGRLEFWRQLRAQVEG